MSLCEVPGCTASAQYPKIDGQPNAIRARWCDRHALERSLSQSRRDTVPLTKAQIDALVDGMERDGALVADTTYISDATATWHLPTRAVRQALYKSAGLTASGERKPERVRCVRIVNPEYPADNHFWAEGGEDLFPPHYQVTPGWFVPDGAE